MRFIIFMVSSLQELTPFTQPIIDLKFMQSGHTFMGSNTNTNAQAQHVQNTAATQAVLHSACHPFLAMHLPTAYGTLSCSLNLSYLRYQHSMLVHANTARQRLPKGVSRVH